MTTTSTSPRSSSDGPLSAIAPRGAIVRGGTYVWCSTRTDGDFHRTEVPVAELEARRRAVVDLPWTMLDQRHGTEAVVVERPGAGDGRVGDIAVTDLVDAVLGCWVGDCAPIALVGERRFAVVHAGWRGLAAGIVDRAVELFDEPIAAVVLGPAIGACCYEFGADDLDAVAAGVHTTPDRIASTTLAGRPALDVPQAVAAGFGALGLSVESIGGCTGCTWDGFSHRVRRDPARHVLAVWRPSGGAAA